MIKHIDLFSGIGGFAYAADQVFGDVEHIFCDNDKFCKAVLAKHWPESDIFDDIKKITANTYGARLKGQELLQQGRQGRGRGNKRPFLLTGGFPCQPFSAAGLRRGTADERHLWPEMLRIIRLTKPEWIIAENVRGITNWNNGVVFEQVCSDLEAAGYEVQAFIIPAVAVNAPHRRDRVWFVAHTEHHRDRGSARLENGTPRPQRVQERHEVRESIQPGHAQPVTADTNRPKPRGAQPRSGGKTGGVSSEHRPKDGAARQPERADSIGSDNRPDTHASSQQAELARQSRQNSDGHVTNSRCLNGNKGRRQKVRPDGQESRESYRERADWGRDWAEVAAEFCRVDDGLPVALDGFKLSKSQHRKEQLKAYGNAIVPQVAMKIMQAIKESSYAKTTNG